MVQHAVATVQGIQAAVDAGKPASRYYLNPVKVVRTNLKNDGFTAPFTIHPPVRVSVSYRSAPYQILLAQRATRGPRGAWFITSILRQHPPQASTATASPEASPTIGPIPSNPTADQRVQQYVNDGNSSYLYYLNPAAVVRTNLPKHGLSGPITLTSVRVTVSYRAHLYDVTLKQPATHGATGIWMIVNIGRHM